MSRIFPSIGDAERIIARDQRKRLTKNSRRLLRREFFYLAGTIAQQHLPCCAARRRRGELRGDWPLRRADGSRRTPFPPYRRSDTGCPCGDRSAAFFHRGSARSQGSASLIRCGLFHFCFQNRPPFTRKVISGFLMLTLVSLSTDSVRKALPPMTTLSPTSVAPPSSVAPA